MSCFGNIFDKIECSDSFIISWSLIFLERSIFDGIKWKVTVQEEGKLFHTTWNFCGKHSFYFGCSLHRFGSLGWKVLFVYLIFDAIVSEWQKRAKKIDKKKRIRSFYWKKISFDKKFAISYRLGFSLKSCLVLNCRIGDKRMSDKGVIIHLHFMSISRQIPRLIR